MKLRLPLALWAALMISANYSYTASYAEDIVITENKDYGDTTPSFSNGTLTIGMNNGGKTPAVSAKTMWFGGNGHMVMKSGTLTLKKASNLGLEYSLWIGNENSGGTPDSTVNIYGGRLECEDKIQFCRWGNKGILRIYDGAVKASGLFSEHNPDDKCGEVWLLGGNLTLGKGGIDGLKKTNEANPSLIKTNLIQGSLSSYESWSSTTKIVLQLDSVGKKLPDTVMEGNTPKTYDSDGTHSLTITPAEGTTITLDSKIEGTGTGRLIKTGMGALELNNEKNTFTQCLELKEGTLKAGFLIPETTTLETTGPVEASLGTGDTIYITGTSTFIFEGESLSKKIDFSEAGETITLTLQSNSLTGTRYTGEFKGTKNLQIAGNAIFEGGGALGTFTLDSGASLDLKTGTYTVKDGSAITVGDSTSLSVGGSLMGSTSLMTVEAGGTLTMNLGAGSNVDLKGIHAGAAQQTEITLAGGTLKLGSDGLSLKRVDTPSATEISGVFNFNSGILESTATWALAHMDSGDSATPQATFLLGGESDTRTIKTNTGHTVTINSVIGDKLAESGNFIKTGSGILELTGENSYSGGTTISEGSVYLSNNKALGSGSFTMAEGTTIAASVTPDSTVTLTQSATFGTKNTGESSLIFGVAGKLGSLAITGNVSVTESIKTWETNADVTVGGSGNLTFAKTSLTKTGSGTLTLAGDFSSSNKLDVLDIKAGNVVLGGGNHLTHLSKINVATGSGMDLGGESGSTAVSLNYAGTGFLAGAENYAGKLILGAGDTATDSWTVRSTVSVSAGEVSLESEYARLVIDGAGTFTVGKVKFTLGAHNAVSQVDSSAALITAGSSHITGVDLGSIALDFDADYLAKNLKVGGTFQLFSSGLDYTPNTIEFQSNYVQAIVFEIMTDPSDLANSGAIKWKERGTQAILKPTDISGPYNPGNVEDYLGADGVTIKADIEYNLDGLYYEKYQYQLTPGTGTIIYQGILDNTAKALYISDYSEMADGNPISAGNVTLTHNGNTYGKGTNIMSATLVVDLSQGSDQSLADLQGAVMAGNLDVHALGSGEVVLVSGLKSGQGATLRLQAYGDTDASTIGAKTFTYANDFKLQGNKDGGSVLVQAGANEQIIRGNIVSATGANIIANENHKDFILRGNVSKADDSALIFGRQGAAGRIVLDGNAGKLTAKNLSVADAATLRITNEYTAEVQKVTMAGGTLEVHTGGKLSVATGGISGAGQILLSGGMLSSGASWSSDMAITLAAGTVSSINSGGANVTLNKGVSGTGSFEKMGSGNLVIFDNKDTNAAVNIDVKQGRLVLRGSPPKGRAVTPNSEEYRLTGDLTVSSGKGGALEGMIDANNHKVTFGDKTHFYLGLSAETGATGHIRNADTISFGTGTLLHVNALDETWVTAGVSFFL